MLHDPEEPTLFPHFTPEQLESLAPYGERVRLAPGEVLFEQGGPTPDFYVVLDGQVSATKRMGGEEVLLAVHGPGGFAGELSLLGGTPPIATARAVGPVEVLRIPAGRFRELIATSEPVARLVLPALAGRLHEVDAQLQQQEKLAALGRMAAGLAHELNNPAAAARRAAAQLAEAMAEAQEAAIRLHSHPLSADQQALLDRLHAEARECCTSPLPLAPLERSEREDAVCDWLDEHGVDDGWKATAVLVTAGIDPARLAELAEVMGEERMEGTVRWLAATLSTTLLLREVEQSTLRISQLVKSVKQYTHMDRSPELRETDLHEGLESTLALLHHKLKQGVEVVREYDPALPAICAYAGELNQVWTNLIDNAVDAMGGKGKLTVRTSRPDDEWVEVEIADDGPGIAPEVRERIWEPFFTTKGVGEGSGLGLDIVRRIVQRRHGGSLSVTSRPGDTRFRVTLRIAGPPREVERLGKPE